ncbi:alpha/beta fold hydrolase [Carboxydothermus islandicus]
MTGMKDQILRHENSDILRKNIPNSRLMKFSPAGHGFFEEVPEV